MINSELLLSKLMSHVRTITVRLESDQTVLILKDEDSEILAEFPTKCVLETGDELDYKIIPEVLTLLGDN